MNGAIVGLGHGDRVISKAFRIEKIKLLGVYSKNIKKVQKYSKENNLQKIYKSIDDLINDQEIDLIVIFLLLLHLFSSMLYCVYQFDDYCNFLCYYFFCLYVLSRDSFDCCHWCCHCIDGQNYVGVIVRLSFWIDALW